MTESVSGTPHLFRTKWHARARAWPPLWALGAVVVIGLPLAAFNGLIFYYLRLRIGLPFDTGLLIFTGIFNVVILLIFGSWYLTLFFATLRLDATGIRFGIPLIPSVARVGWADIRGAYLVFDDERLVRVHLWPGRRRWTRLSIAAFADPDAVARAVLLALAVAGISGKTFTRDPATLRALRLTQWALALVVVVGGITAAWWRLPVAGVNWVSVRLAAAALMGFAGCSVRVPMRRRDRWTLVLWGVLYGFFVTMWLRNNAPSRDPFQYFGPAMLWETIAEVALAALAAFLGLRIYWPVRSGKELVVSG